VGTKTHAQKISSRPISFPQDAITCTRDRQAYFSDYPFARSVKKQVFSFKVLIPDNGPQLFPSKLRLSTGIWTPIYRTTWFLRLTADPSQHPERH